MDFAIHDRDMNHSVWRRWLLMSALVALGCSYILAYSIFVTRSQDFIVAKLNQRALDFSRKHVINPPAKLQFGLGNDDTARLGGGWHQAEADGIWSQEDDAWIEMHLSGTDDARVVYLNTTAFVAKRHRRIIVAADINGIKVGSWIRDMTNASDPLDIHIPQALSRPGQFTIHLHIEHGASPFDAHDGPDKRQLGLKLSSIEVL